MAVDVIVVGAGPGGLACAITAAEGGARVLVLDKAGDIGGALHFSGGHLSAGGFSAQRDKGITDDVAAHWDDVRRISRGLGREDLTLLSLHEQPAVLEWLLDAGLRLDPETPRIVHGHEQYSTPRTVHATETPGGPEILRVLRLLLAPHTASGAVEVRCATPVRDLLVRDGAVAGVITESCEEIEAPAVVLATGGFGHHPGLFSELEGAPLTTSAAPTSTGDGLEMARRIGAGLQGLGRYIPTFGGLPPEPGDPRVDWNHRPQLVAPERAPWEVYVDRSGARWVAEDDPSIDHKERALTGIERMTFWMVFDAAALDASRPMVHGWTPEELDAQCGVRRGVHKGDTLEELASRAGIDPEGLVAGIARYNGFVTAGKDDDFGRAHLPAPILKAPFYAVENHPVTLITFTGVDVDEESRVRRADGSVIEGLYAVGEVIGSAAVNGNAFCSGMCLTPAMAFGRLVGRALTRG
ncbi:FAD-dependent oxidoreductase [Actinocorallia aurea]